MDPALSWHPHLLSGAGATLFPSLSWAFWTLSPGPSLVDLTESGLPVSFPVKVTDSFPGLASSRGLYICYIDVVWICLDIISQYTWHVSNSVVTFCQVKPV